MDYLELNNLTKIEGMSACITICQRLSVEGGSGTKPEQLHHFATNKNKTYTPQFEEIANKYGLDLDDAWNLDSRDSTLGYH